MPLAEVAGITVPEQPWEKMLAGKTPATEPLARFVPHDNYYVYFRDLRKFIAAGELLDEWGTSLLRVYEVRSRDYQLRPRYEQQLCLKTTVLGKVLGPTLVKGLAVTGSDPYFREGTDVTLIFHVVNRGLFLAAVEGFLRDARQAHGSSLTENRDEYHGNAIERFVTPLREVSLHRAAVKDEALGEFVIYSNSPVGVRRALDAHQARGKRLADENDFRYMRTVFPLDGAAGDRKVKEDKPREPAEDGFVFLSDAFIRQLTSPATRIKEKRRLEAFTSTYMLTNAALLRLGDRQVALRPRRRAGRRRAADRGRGDARGQGDRLGPAAATGCLRRLQHDPFQHAACRAADRPRDASGGRAVPAVPRGVCAAMADVFRSHRPPAVAEPGARPRGDAHPPAGRQRRVPDAARLRRPGHVSLRPSQEARWSNSRSAWATRWASRCNWTAATCCGK